MTGKRYLAVLVILAGVAIASTGGRRSLAPTGAPAQVAAAVAFSPGDADADTQRVVSFAGFAGAETIDITFFDASNAQVAVGDGMIYYASTQDDGTGEFNFVPSEWLLPLSKGTWTAQV